MQGFILFFLLLKKYGLASRFVVPRFPRETGASKLLFWLLCFFYLGRQDTFCVCGFFLFPFSMYVCQKESRERQWVVGGLSGFFCVAGASQHYAIHSDSFSSLSCVGLGRLCFEWRFAIGDLLQETRAKGTTRKSAIFVVYENGAVSWSLKSWQYLCVCWRKLKNHVVSFINNPTITLSKIMLNKRVRCFDGAPS